MAAVPAFTLPKATAAGLADKVVVLATPLPLTAIVAVEFEALLLRLMLPEMLPAFCGAKRTVKVLLWPAAIVSGVAKPKTEKPTPVPLSWLMVRLAAPVLVMVTGCVFDWPSRTLPKLTLAGEILI